MLILLLFLIIVAVQGDNLTEPIGLSLRDGDQYAAEEIVKLQFYYETGCPYSIKAYIGELLPLVQEMGQYLDISTYPYGNARVIMNGTEVTINCQHGPKECYGNELHACAIDVLKDVSKYIPINSCMIENKQMPTDETVDTCGKKLNIDPEPIKSCAKDMRGFELLLHYGIESGKVSYPGVPWWLVNGKPRDDTTLKKEVCAAFKNPPKPCEQLHKSSLIPYTNYSISNQQFK